MLRKGLQIVLGLVLTCTLSSCTSRSSDSLIKLKVAVSPGGKVAITEESTRVAVSDKLGGGFRIIDLGDSSSDSKYTYAAWSSDGVRLALTKMGDKESSVVIYDTMNGSQRVIPDSKADIVVHWPRPDTIIVLRASRFNRPGRLLGPIYEGLTPRLINVATGREEPYSGAYLQKTSPGGFAASGDWIASSSDPSEPYRYRLMLLHKEKAVCTTTKGGFYSSVSITDDEVVALWDKPNDRDFEVVGISKQDCGVRVIYDAAMLEDVAHKLRR